MWFQPNFSDDFRHAKVDFISGGPTCSVLLEALLDLIQVSSLRHTSHTPVIRVFTVNN